MNHFLPTLFSSFLFSLFSPFLALPRRARLFARFGKWKGNICYVDVIHSVLCLITFDTHLNVRKGTYYLVVKTNKFSPIPTPHSMLFESENERIQLLCYPRQHCRREGGRSAIHLTTFGIVPILGDPGAVSGGGKKSKRARKKFGRRKVKNDEKSS